MRTLAVVAVCLAAATVPMTVLAQTSGQFRDERPGKIWTPETVSQDNKAAPPT